MIAPNYVSIAPDIFVGGCSMNKCDFCGNDYEELFRFDDNYSQSLICRFCLAEQEEYCCNGAYHDELGGEG
jgi:hypothetical protein